MPGTPSLLTPVICAGAAEGDHGPEEPVSPEEAAPGAAAEEAAGSGVVAPPPPEREPEAPRWGLGDAGVGLLGGFLAASVTVGLWAAFAGSTERSLGAMAAGWIGLWAGFVGIPLLASRRKGTGSLAADFGLRARPADGAGLAVGALCQALLVPALYFLIQRLTGDLDVSRPARELAEDFEGAAFVVVGVMATFAAPVVEELFYRGLLLRAALRRFGVRWAVLGSSAVFGLSHFQLVQFPGLFAFGVVLALLAVRTGRLGASIAAHVAFNGVAVIGLVLAR